VNTVNDDAAVHRSGLDRPAVAVDGAAPPARLGRVRRLLRYTGVNLATLALDYAIFIPLTRATDLPVTASIVAYVVALAANYQLSRLFVFGSDGSHKGERRLFLQFFATGLLGLVLTAAVTGLGVHVLGKSPVLSKTIAVLICFVVLYIIRSRLVFTRVD
jgi:putative flippase GtrA